MNPATAPKPTPKSKPDSQPAKPTARSFSLDSRMLRLILLGSLGLSILFFVLVLFAGSSTLGNESKKMVDLKVKSQSTQAQLDNLEQAKKQVEAYSFFKDVAQTVIPNDKDQAADVVEINNMAEESGIAIQSITFPASTLGLTTSTTTATTQPQDATSSSSTSKAISQAKPVTGIPGLYSLELTITPESDINTPANKQITYAKMLDFLNRIEDNRHTAQITSVIISPAGTINGGNKNFTFSLTTNIFIKP